MSLAKLPLRLARVRGHATKVGEQSRAACTRIRCIRLYPLYPFVSVVSVVSAHLAPQVLSLRLRAHRWKRGGLEWMLVDVCKGWAFPTWLKRESFGSPKQVARPRARPRPTDSHVLACALVICMHGANLKGRKNRRKKEPIRQQEWDMLFELHLVIVGHVHLVSHTHTYLHAQTIIEAGSRHTHQKAHTCPAQPIQRLASMRKYTHAHIKRIQ